MSSKAPISAEELLEELNRRIRGRDAPHGALEESAGNGTSAGLVTVLRRIRAKLERVLLGRSVAAAMSPDAARTAPSADESVRQAARIRRLEDLLKESHADVENLRQGLVEIERRLSRIEGSGERPGSPRRTPDDS